MQFEFAALPWQIIFGAGSVARLPAELDQRNLRRALVLSTPEQRAHAEQIATLIGERAAGIFAGAVMHVPVATVDEALAAAASAQADCTISIGGGSTTGLGKALALRAELANIAIPTTYAGSEMTNVWGMTEAGRKQTGRDNRVVPTFAIYDPELTVDLPAAISGPSGLNAMAQAVVNVTAATPNPVITALAIDGIRAIARGLPTVIRAPADITARSDVLYGACLCGAALGVGVTGLHHRLCHTLGGSFNTSHADTHAILLAYSVAYNASAVVEGTARVAEALGTSDAAGGIFDLLHTVSEVTTLAQLGLTAADLDRAAAIATETPCANPAPVSRVAVRDLLGRAYAGERP